jgi:hypothetical protein
MDLVCSIQRITEKLCSAGAFSFCSKFFSFKRNSLPFLNLQIREHYCYQKVALIHCTVIFIFSQTHPLNCNSILIFRSYICLIDALTSLPINNFNSVGSILLMTGSSVCINCDMYKVDYTARVMRLNKPISQPFLPH